MIDVEIKRAVIFILLRRFRASDFFISITRGVAPGYDILPLWGIYLMNFNRFKMQIKTARRAEIF